MAILSALLLPALVVFGEPARLDWFNLKSLVAIPTLAFALKTRSLGGTIILGMAGLIRDKPGEWVEDGTRKIEEHSRILLHHVNQMLDLARLESSESPLLHDRVDLEDLVHA